MSHPRRSAINTLATFALPLFLLAHAPMAGAAESAHAHAHGHSHSHASSASAHGHDHGHGSTEKNEALVLNHGKKWASDAALRTAMKKVAALTGKTGVPDPAAAKRIHDGINQQVAYMVKNCHLEAKADAVLHGLIAELLAGATAVTDPAKAEAGIAQIRQALLQYPQYFKHPGWKG